MIPNSWRLAVLLACLAAVGGCAGGIAEGPPKSKVAVSTTRPATQFDRLSSLGRNLIIVIPAQSGVGGVMVGTRRNLTLGDALALRAVPGVARVSPVVSARAQVKCLNKNLREQVIGVASTYLLIRDREVAAGRELREFEIEGNHRVAVLGPQTAEDLFGSDDPIGQTITINGINFSLVGVLKSKGDTGFFNLDDRVLVPYTCAMKQLFPNGGDARSQTIGEIDIQHEDQADSEAVERGISAVLRKRHGLATNDPDDFNVRSLRAMRQTMQQVR